MTDTLLHLVKTAILNGASVSQVERQFGISNRNVRRLKASMYESGLLPKPTGFVSKVNHADNNR